jgi:hypothetical protein
MHILVEHRRQIVAFVKVVEEGHWRCRLRRRWSLPMAYRVCRIVVDSAALHCIRHIVVGEVENIRMVAEEEEVAGSRSRLVEGEVRSSVVGSSLAGVGTAVVVLRILRGIQLLDILT